MKPKLIVAASFLVAIVALGYAAYLRTQLFWWKDSLLIHTKMLGLCEAQKDFYSGVYRVWEKELDPAKDDKYSGRKDGPLEIWGAYYRPKLGEYETVRIEGYIDGYNTMMRKLYSKRESSKERKRHRQNRGLRVSRSFRERGRHDIPRDDHSKQEGDVEIQGEVT